MVILMFLIVLMDIWILSFLFVSTAYSKDAPPATSTLIIERADVPLTVEDRIILASTLAGIDSDTALRIARCESSLDPLAANPGGTAKGLFQFIDATWAFIGSPGDRFDVDANIKQFMIWYPKHPNWWQCR